MSGAIVGRDKGVGSLILDRQVVFFTDEAPAKDSSGISPVALLSLEQLVLYYPELVPNQGI